MQCMKLFFSINNQINISVWIKRKRNKRMKWINSKVTLLMQEEKSVHAWKDELPGIKREILSLSSYHCYRKDPFPSAASKVADVLTKPSGWQLPCLLLVVVTAKHTHWTHLLDTQTLNLIHQKWLKYISTPCLGNVTTSTGSGKHSTTE